MQSNSMFVPLHRTTCCCSCSHGGPDYLSMPYNMKRPVYVQSTWLKSRAVMDKYPMRFGFVTDLLEQITLCK